MFTNWKFNFRFYIMLFLFFRINSNVDLIVSGAQLLSRMKIEPADPIDHDDIKSMDHFREAYTLFFSRGAPGERYMSNEELFSELVRVSETLRPVEVCLLIFIYCRLIKLCAN